MRIKIFKKKTHKGRGVEKHQKKKKINRDILMDVFGLKRKLYRTGSPLKKDCKRNDLYDLLSS